MKSNSPIPVTHAADNPHFNYYGRWHRGRTAISINSGSLVEFAYLGRACVLAFDVAGFAQYPAVFVQVDNGPVIRTPLSDDVSAVAVQPTYGTWPVGTPPFPGVSSRYHLVRFWVAAHSLYQTDSAGRQWTTLVGGCRFVGVRLDGGDLVPWPVNPNQIEFLGDSLTQGLRLLYTGRDDDTALQLPYANWPQFVADLLGLKPIVTGFGGQGLTTTGTSGAPPAAAAFPFIRDGVKWDPLVKPRVAVIYHGTNDSVSPPEFHRQYMAYLAIIRKFYPSATIFAVCPHNKTNYAAAIRDAVSALGDHWMRFLDYSAAVISANETCDGCHLNPGGAVVLAARLAADIAAGL